MLQRRRGLDLREESLGADHGGELGAQHLERDLAVVLQVVCEIHRGHAARAKLALETVTVGERGDETFGCFGQGTSIGAAKGGARQ